MIEFLMVFPDREAAQDVADELVEEGGFASVRVVSEALAGEDDAEDVDWVVHVVADHLDDPTGPLAQEIAERFSTVAQDHDGWLDNDRSADGYQPDP